LAAAAVNSLLVAVSATTWAVFPNLDLLVDLNSSMASRAPFSGFSSGSNPAFTTSNVAAEWGWGRGKKEGKDGRRWEGKDEKRKEKREEKGEGVYVNVGDIKGTSKGIIRDNTQIRQESKNRLISQQLELRGNNLASSF